MRLCRVPIASKVPAVPAGLAVSMIFVLLFSGAASAQVSTGDTLSPEKTQMIYDTLLPNAGSGSRIPEEEKTAQRPATPGMTVEKIEAILRGKDIELKGKPSRWEFLSDGMQFFFLTDTENNRVRIMTPLARLDLLRREPGFSEIELLQEMLRANYLATGDTRLCMNKHIVWAAFLHPLDSLTERDLVGALDQLAETARKTRGDID